MKLVIVDAQKMPETLLIEGVKQSLPDGVHICWHRLAQNEVTTAVPTSAAAAITTRFVTL